MSGRRTSSTRRFRVGVNLLWMVPGNVGGTEEYTTRLLQAVPKVDLPGVDRIDYRIFATPAVAEAHSWLANMGEVVISPDPGTSRLRRVGIEATWLRRQSRGCAFVHHFGGTVPLRNRVPAVTTIHDLQPVDAPGTFGSVKARWLAQRLPVAVVESSRVLTPSQWVADRIVETYDADPAKLTVVASSHSHSQSRPTSEPHSVPTSESAPADDSLLADLGLTRPYVLYPAISYPHKNHQVLIEALANCGSGFDLVLTGRPDVAHDALVSAIDRLGVGGRVHIAGRLDAEAFERVLSHARALVFPSTYEGFGLPLIEAMARGVPVVASDLPVLREVAGDHAMWVDPHDAAGWATAMQQVIGQAVDASAIDAARTHAQQFSPQASATRLVEVYRNLLGLDYWERA